MRVKFIWNGIASILAVAAIFVAFSPGHEPMPVVLGLGLASITFAILANSTRRV